MRTLQATKHIVIHEFTGRQSHYQAYVTIFSLVVQKLENPNLSIDT